MDEITREERGEAASLSWGESLSARGTGRDMTVSIDVLLPDGQAAEVALDRAAATMLHAQLGDALEFPPADRAAVLREAADLLDLRASSLDALLGGEARAVRELAGVANELRRMADEAPGGGR
ncbi:hypothetical protein [Streptomyces sp. NEAU-H3]|uniref:hypothetical protein n=1 Tax=Streptomyces sp. NEAU-H3 TaxID=2720636 RepID=UPI00143C1E85|nr:hypothetical protein [Streptomyces sp. NEAU-H3]NJA56681.1 hypothetical protein [Streptomyces sp. NEAU-H3]